MLRIIFLNLPWNKTWTLRCSYPSLGGRIVHIKNGDGKDSIRNYEDVPDEWRGGQKHDFEGNNDQVVLDLVEVGDRLWDQEEKLPVVKNIFLWQT